MSFPHYPEFGADEDKFRRRSENREALAPRYDQEEEEQEQIGGDDSGVEDPATPPEGGGDNQQDDTPLIGPSRTPDSLGYSEVMGRDWLRPIRVLPPDVLKKIVGCSLAILAGCCFTGSDFVLKEFQLDYVEVLLMRCVVQIISNGIFMGVKGYKFWPSHANAKEKIFMMMNSIFSALRMVCIYSSILLMPLGDAITIFFTIPLFTMVFSLIFLRVPIKLWKITFGFFLMVGVVLIVRPPFLFPPPEVANDIANNVTNTSGFWDISADPSRGGSTVTLFQLPTFLSTGKDDPHNHNHMYYVGVLLALGVALFGGLANVAVAVCGRGIDSSVLVFYCGLICIPVGLVASSFDPNQRIISRLIVNIPPQEWGELLLQSSLSLTGTVLTTLSIKLANPILSSVLTPVVEIVLSYILQTTVMGDTPAALAIIGATVVVASVVAITLEKQCVRQIPMGCRNYW